MSYSNRQPSVVSVISRIYSRVGVFGQNRTICRFLRWTLSRRVYPRVGVIAPLPVNAIPGSDAACLGGIAIVDHGATEFATALPFVSWCVVAHVGGVAGSAGESLLGLVEGVVLGLGLR